MYRQRRKKKKEGGYEAICIVRARRERVCLDTRDCRCLCQTVTFNGTFDDENFRGSRFE